MASRVSEALPNFRPVLKWAGGKRQLLPQILARLPQRIPTYFEPFVGGGAVFFELARQRRFDRAVLADKNTELIAAYRALKEDVDSVLSALQKLADRHCEEEYYRVREARPRSLPARAARFIYLNRTGFNGLYRVNRSGKFNVPFGRYANPTIVDALRLRAAAAALGMAEILDADFEQVCTAAKRGHAVYLDPPYLPVSRTAKFAEYHQEPFGLDEHRRLAGVFAALERRGVAAVLSNSHTPETQQLFGRFHLEVVNARRSINSDARGRGAVGEILVRTRSLAERKASRSVRDG